MAADRRGRDYRIVEATHEHAESMALFMRLGDYIEAWRATGLSAERALIESLENSAEAWTVLTPEGEILFMAGVSPIRPGLAMPWSLGTELIKRRQKAFMLASRELLGRMRAYGALANLVDAGNARAARYLMKLGFVVLDEAVGAGPHHAPFRPFFMRSE